MAPPPTLLEEEEEDGGEDGEEDDLSETQSLREDAYSRPSALGESRPVTITTPPPSLLVIRRAMLGLRFTVSV